MSLTRMKNQEKNHSITECNGCGKCRVMNTIVDCLSCREVEAVKYFSYIGHEILMQLFRNSLLAVLQSCSVTFNFRMRYSILKVDLGLLQ